MSTKTADSISFILNEYVTSAAARMEARLGRKVGRVIPVAPGTAPAWDEVCNGLIYGRVVSIVPQTAANPGTACGVLHWTATLAIAVVECVETVQSAGNRVIMPSAASIDESGDSILRAADDVMQTLLCGEHTRTFVNGVPLQEEGGAVGWEWTFTVRLGVCFDCPPGA